MAEEPSDESSQPAPHAGAVSVDPPASARARRDRLSLVIPGMLAAIGLAAALIAWRTSVAAGAADAATQAGLDAARQRAASVIVGEGLTARSTEAYIDFERARRRAELLDEDGQAAIAQLARMEATSHWFLVPPQYVGADGAYDPERQRAALLAADEQRIDIQPEPHFATADREEARIRDLLVAGILIALALPLLTVAEVSRGPLRGGMLSGGTAVFALGAVLAAAVWL